MDELVRDRLVERERNPADARSAFAVLTDSGQSRFRAAAPRYVAAIQEEFAEGLTDRELRQLAVALARVRDRVSR